MAAYFEGGTPAKGPAGRILRSETLMSGRPDGNRPPATSRSGFGRQPAPTHSVRIGLASLWQTASTGALAIQQAGRPARPDLRFGLEPPPESNGDPILTIDARAVHDAMQHLRSLRNRAGGRRR